MSFKVLNLSIVLLMPAFIIAQGNNNVDDDKSLYSSRYDTIDIDIIFRSSRLLNNYVDCLLDKKPCPPEGKELKRVLPGALKTRCARCTKLQKSKSLDVITRLYYQHPSMYLSLAERYDPTGEYTKNFEKWYDEQQQSQNNDIPQRLNRIPSTWITSPTTTQRTTTSTTTSRPTLRTLPSTVRNRLDAVYTPTTQRPIRVTTTSARRTSTVRVVPFERGIVQQQQPAVPQILRTTTTQAPPLPSPSLLFAQQPSPVVQQNVVRTSTQAPQSVQPIVQSVQPIVTRSDQPNVPQQSQNNFQSTQNNFQQQQQTQPSFQSTQSNFQQQQQPFPVQQQPFLAQQPQQPVIRQQQQPAIQQQQQQFFPQTSLQPPPQVFNRESFIPIQQEQLSPPPSSSFRPFQQQQPIPVFTTTTPRPSISTASISRATTTSATTLQSTVQSTTRLSLPITSAPAIQIQTSTVRARPIQSVPATNFNNQPISTAVNAQAGVASNVNDFPSRSSFSSSSSPSGQFDPNLIDNFFVPRNGIFRRSINQLFDTQAVNTFVRSILNG